MTEIGYRRMLTLIGSLALTGVGIVDFLGGEEARLLQAGLSAVSLVVIAVFIFHLGERHGIAKQKEKDDQHRGA
ncbi:hypothetical protein VB779_06590 [Haloarculaceae archaeon H-GB11]|nr:hypothetical protein [Haloarculaceae archaeon H-GB11]